MDKMKIPNNVLFEEVATVLQEGREAVILPTGKSMLPFIREDVDRVVLRKKDSYAVGDIVLAHFGGRYVLHRIVALDGDAVTLMGLYYSEAKGTFRVGSQRGAAEEAEALGARLARRLRDEEERG